MQINFLKQFWRAHRGFITHNTDALNRKRDEQIGVAQRIMIKEVVGAGAEVIEIQSPAPHGNGQTYIVLLVALAAQRQKSLLWRDTQDLRRNRIQRRRLVIAAVRAAHNPAKMRNLDRYTQPWTSRRFCYQSGETREAHARR